MKSFVAKSTLTEASNSTSIDEVNEIRRAQNVKISASLPSTETRQIQHRLTVPIESNISTKQSFNSPQNSKKSRGSQSGLRKRLVPSILSQIKSKQPLISQVSVADKQLKEIIQNLHDHPIEEEIFNENQSSINARGKYIGRSRRFLRRLMEKPKFHYIIITLIIVDLIVVFVELILGNDICFKPILIFVSFRNTFNAMSNTRRNGRVQRKFPSGNVYSRTVTPSRNW